MSGSKIQIKVGIVEFSGEGNQDWLATQLDKILDRLPELLKIELVAPTEKGNGSNSAGGGAKPDNDSKPANLPRFLKDKSATTSQVKKFLATAAYLQLNGKSRMTTSDIAKALKDANQNKLTNPSDCLAKNVGKGLAEKEKDGSKDFFVTSEGFKEFSISID